jgi:hypothetical protein
LIEEVRKNITPSSYVFFSIQVRGREIPADKLAIIFGRFVQLNVQASRRKGGTALEPVRALCNSTRDRFGQKVCWEQEVLFITLQHEAV